MKCVRFLLVALLISSATACSKKHMSADAEAAAQASATAAAADAAKSAEMKAAHEVTVLDIQTALNKAGANLKADGKMGKGTRRAIREYQKSNKLKVTGNADDATLKSLGLK